MKGVTVLVGLVGKDLSQVRPFLYDMDTGVWAGFRGFPQLESIGGVQEVYLLFQCQVVLVLL